MILVHVVCALILMAFFVGLIDCATRVSGSVQQEDEKGLLVAAFQHLLAAYDPLVAAPHPYFISLEGHDPEPEFLVRISRPETPVFRASLYGVRGTRLLISEVLREESGLFRLTCECMTPLDNYTLICRVARREEGWAVEDVFETMGKFPVQGKLNFS